MSRFTGQTLRVINTARFSVSLTWDYEWDKPDTSWDETGETERQLQSGELVSYIFSVTVYLDGNEIAYQCLGDSIYGDPEDFAREHMSGDGCNGKAYFPQMVREAIREARAAVRAMVPVRLREGS